MRDNARIYIAGHRGLVGSALCRKLEAEGFCNLVTHTHEELDLCRQADVDQFFRETRPEYVFLAAAVVGGIHANDVRPVDFLKDNLLIQTNVIDAAWRYGVEKLAFLGSTCVYPRDCPQPIKEDSLLTGPLEETNQWYAVAKIAGIKLCQAYRRQYGFNAIALMPTNLYGPHDNFDLLNSHVLPALIRKFHEAKINQSKTVDVWGSGKPLREFLHVDDLADACFFLMENYDDAAIINIGSGRDISIGELAELIREITACPSKIVFNPSRPDGTPRKLADVSKLTALGWKSRISLRAGIQSCYEWYLDSLSE